MEKVPGYAALFGRLGFGEAGLLDKLLYEEEAKRCVMCYEQQFHFGVFYAYMKLREQVRARGMLFSTLGRTARSRGLSTRAWLNCGLGTCFATTCLYAAPSCLVCLMGTMPSWDYPQRVEAS